MVGAWTCANALFFGRFIYHDSWIHNFPLVFHVAKNGACGALPSWLSGVDSGYPTLIQAISTTITQPFRLIALYAMSCAELGVVPAMFVHKIQLYLSYLLFAVGMYLLGRLLYRNHAAAVFLLAATLFAGLCLQNAHSDQIVNILFWVPWVVACCVLFLRCESRSEGAHYLNLAALFVGVQLLDQYPHFVVLSAGVAFAMLLINRRDFLTGWTPVAIARLWPIAVIGLVAGLQLLSVKSSIAHYRPSLRADLVVDPELFGETGFLQPTAFIGTFFSLALMRDFDQLAAGMRTWLASHGGAHGASWFMYRLDSFFMYFGIIPILGVAVFLMRRAQRALKTGWAGFTLIMLLVSMQQSGFYKLLFHVPFFDVFRSYALYLCHVAFAVLVMSGYGVDALLSEGAEERRRLIRKAALWVLVLAAAMFAWLAWLVLLSQNPLGSSRKILPLLILDGFLLFLSLRMADRWAVAASPSGTAMRRMLVFFTTTQILYFAAAYVGIGVSLERALVRMGMGPGHAPARAVLSRASSPIELQRKVCEVFAQCYLAQGDQTSLSTELQGTFFRSREAPMFQPGLERSVILALSGVTHPPIWASFALEGYRAKEEAIERLNRSAARIDEYLRSSTQVRTEDLGLFASTMQLHPQSVTLGAVERTRDSMHLHYQSDGPFFLNIAFTFDPQWKGEIDGQAVPIGRANFDAIVALVPAGQHAFVLRYSNPVSDFFFYARYALVLLALMGLVLVSRRATSADFPSASQASLSASLYPGKQ